MGDLYETSFGFYDQLSKANPRPLSSIAMFQTESNGYNSRLYTLFKNYKEAKIAKYFNITLLEFLALPREQIEWMFSLSVEFDKDEATKNEQMFNQLTTPPPK